MLKNLLFLLEILVIVSPSTPFNYKSPHHRYQVPTIRFWKSGLPTRPHANQFISTKKMIAREMVSLPKQVTPRAPVMGSNYGRYPLFDLLKYVDDYRSNHVTILVFKNLTDLCLAKWTLASYNKNWIWLQFSTIQGPHGDEPNFDSFALEAEVHDGLAKKLWIVYDLTTNMKKPYGYLKIHSDLLTTVAFKGSLEFFKGVLLLDVIHASHSTELPTALMKTQMEYVILEERAGFDPKAINFKGLFALIGKVGIEKIYLDVRPDIRNKICKKFKIGLRTRTNKTLEKNGFWRVERSRLLNSWLVAIVICFYIYLY